MNTNEKPVLFDALIGKDFAILKTIRMDERVRGHRDNLLSRSAPRELFVASRSYPQIGFRHEVLSFCVFLPGESRLRDHKVAYTWNAKPEHISLLYRLSNPSIYSPVRYPPTSEEPLTSDLMEFQDVELLNSKGEKLFDVVTFTRDGPGSPIVTLVVGVNPTINCSRGATHLIGSYGFLKRPIENTIFLNTGLVTMDRSHNTVTDFRPSPLYIEEIGSNPTLEVIQEALSEVTVSDPNAFISKRHELQRVLL